MRANGIQIRDNAPDGPRAGPADPESNAFRAFAD